MSAEALRDYHDPELASRRLLTEADHFVEHMDVFGNVSDDVFDAVVQNRTTAVAEIAMPYAVTETKCEVVERINEAGRRERVIMWLAQTALEVASSGYKHHFSQAAFDRVKVEEAEAMHAEATLRPGIAQAFISPKMTRHDASEAIAKAEHLYIDDSLRVSTAITNEHGKVVGRQLKSLLVRDIPFDAWVKMMKDPGNIFGKALPLRNESSAVSVMELFRDLELPEDQLPEGPVALVEAVLPYIDDELARHKVKRQLERFRGNQEFYANEAEMAGREWAMFDLELARSLRRGKATDPLRHFILRNANAWNNESLAIIASCQLGDTQYGMTTELAALLSRGQQKLIGDRLAVVTDNEEALKEVSAAARQQIRSKHEEIKAAYANGADEAYIRALEQQQTQLLHQQTIRSGGGCPGEVESAFGLNKLTDGTGVGETDSPFKSSAEGKANWQWKQGVCQVKTCPSPKPTEVGPCSVCRRCQGQFDLGIDPTKTVVSPKTSQQVGAVSLLGARRKQPKKAVVSAKIPIAA